MNNAICHISGASKTVFAVLMLSFFCCGGNLHAQKIVGLSAPGEPLDRDYEFRERFTYKTNALEWLLLLPNAGIEFDLTKSRYNRSTLSLTAKYKWATKSRMLPQVVYNLFDIRPEYRFYYRSIPGRSSDKPWRAHYIGAYLDYASYSFKFAPTGITGKSAGAGLSWGYDLPRYQYNKCALDIEFGLSVGLQASQYSLFTHDTSTDSFQQKGDARPWHMTPFPVASEFRVALALTPLSVAHKYLLNDPRKLELKNAKEDVKSYFDKKNGSVNRERFEQSNPQAVELLSTRKTRRTYFREYRKYIDSEAADAENSASALLKTPEQKKKLHSYVNARKFFAKMGAWKTPENSEADAGDKTVAEE